MKQGNGKLYRATPARVPDTLGDFLQDWVEEKVWDNTASVSPDCVAVEYQTEPNGGGDTVFTTLLLSELEQANIEIGIVVEYGYACINKVEINKE